MPKFPNLLRPNQVHENRAEAQRITDMLGQPHIQDRPTAMRQLRSIQKTLDNDAPKPFAGAELDRAAKREEELRQELSAGMLTRREMRLNPPGAVGKLQKWNTANAEKVQEWKYLRLRLNAGSEDPDVANLEQYRPEGGAQELDTSVSQIARKEFHGPLGTTGVVTLTDEEMKELGKLNPGLRERIAFLDNDARAVVRDIVRGVLATPEEPKPKREWTEEQKKAAGRRLAEARARKAAQTQQEAPATAAE